MRFLAFVIFTALVAAEPCAAEISLLPGDIRLSGTRARQRVIVMEMRDGKNVRQVEAKLSVADPKIARLEGDIVHPVADGETAVTATFETDKKTVKVRVEGSGKEEAPSFRNHVIPVLTRLGCNSGACHGALAGKGGFKLSLRGYAPEDDHFVLTRQALSRRVNTREPSKSLMLQKPTLAQPHGGGLKLEIESPEFALLADWIAHGAPGPSAKDKPIERIEVFPPNATLKPKAQLQIVVRAWYPDGHCEDVTRLAKFGSTEDLVASVDDFGKVNVAGYGEAAIHVWFSNKVALVRVTSPHTTTVDPKVFATSPRHNFIDELVLKKLQALNIPPSVQANDHEFIRRVYLDAAGILPTPEEIDAFLADKSPDKRAKLIDRLVERTEFIDYWAYKWSDLLLISSRKLPTPAMRSFYQYVRQSVSDNKPWDQFAREILTAKGSNLHVGPANYYFLHKEITDLTETTGLTFLGMSLTCCRCHNHPLEKWTQDQYWSLANLFSQVAIKNGDKASEITVQDLPGKDVLHPRRGVPMPPTPLDAKPLADKSMSRREYFAAWLTSPENPYFARSVVNRVWRNFMGRGLVEAEDDFRQTNPPSNEELLAAVTADFVKHGYDVKRLARTIMTSAAYQRSSVPLAENKMDDRFYSYYLIRRLPAEVVLDAYSQITKVPTSFNEVTVGSSGGTAKTGDYPLGMRALQLPDTQLVSLFLDAFGRPERGQTCSCERQSESSVTQALHLNNGKTLNDKLRDKKSRVEEWLSEKIGDQEAIRRVYKLALSRAPTAEEEAKLSKLMKEASADISRREVLEDLFWAVLTGKEFLFNH